MFAGGLQGQDNQVIDSNGNVVYGWDHGSALAAAMDRYPGCAHFKYDWKTKIYTFVKAGPGYQGTRHYLSPMQQKLATPAFQEASSESENFPGHMSSEFAREEIKSSVSSGQQIVSENEKEEPLIYLQNCGKIYDSFLYNFLECCTLTVGK